MSKPSYKRRLKMGKTVLIDGHHALHRTCFIPELQKLRSPKGEHTGPVFGFLRVLRSTLERFKADNCIVVWDHPSPAAGPPGRRNALYPEYKANRSDKPKPEALEHLSEQLDMLYQILPYLNIKQMSVAGYEGDDLLYLLSTEITNQDAVVVSGDKDLLQLVNGSVEVYRPISDQLVDLDDFEEFTGIHPDAFVLRKAIVGDTSDNIKGVKGVGEKTADKLLRAAFVDECDEWDTESFLTEDYSKLIDLCKNHKTKTANKVSDQWDVVLRNIQLMDLSKNSFHIDLVTRAKILLESSSNTGFTDVELIQELGKYSFTEITGKFAHWITPFRRLR